MRNVYLNNIVDISDPDCEFIREFDREIQKYGALVYSHETNAYQFIKKFEQIDYKKELLPDFMKVENSDPLLKALNLTIHYEFDPETEEDEENLEIWQQLSQIDIPVFDYDDDGEIRLASEIKLYPSESKFTVWFLNRDSYEYILDQDLLMMSMDFERYYWNEDQTAGEWKHEFSRPYGSYWWCTGFKAGHLRVEEPARELRVESRITLKDDEMATQFCSALEQCGLTRITEGSIGVDQFRREGNDVRLVWQNLSHAETTMPVKIVAGANVLAFFMGPLAFLSTLLLDLGLLALVKA